jgi:hypothetical protein
LEDNIIDAGIGSLMYSIDTGKNFQTMFDFGHPVIWLALDPTDPNRMYASVINHAGSGNPGGIWISNNIQENASATWTHCNDAARTQGHPFNIRVLNDGLLIASYSGRRNSAGSFTDSSGIFVSSDHGSSWTDVSDPGMKYWTMDIVTDPNDAAQDTWYVCVFSGWGGAANNLGGIYRTTNRGQSWVKIANTANENIGGLSSVFSITFDPVNKGAAYMNSEGEGLWYSSNIEANTPVMNPVASYPFEQPNRVYFNPFKSNQVWVNSFGNGIEMGLLNSVHNSIVTTEKGALMLVYPNPSGGQYNISLNLPVANQHAKIRVLSSTGEILYEKQLGSIPESTILDIDISGYSKGIYYIQFVDDDGNYCSAKMLLQ